MKRIPITQEERIFLKAIETNAMVVLLMFKIYPMPLNADMLAFDMKWDARKAKKMLSDLSSDGFTALMKGQGYVLTSEARRMVVEFFGNLIALPLEAQALAPESQAQAQQALTAGDVVSAVIEEYASTHTARALKEVEEESSLILEVKDSSPTSKSAHNALETKTILAHTSILFGDPGVVMARLDLNAIRPHYALGWVAQAYDQRKRPEYPRGLEAPAGLVYSRLRDSEQPKPRESYYIAPENYLPDEYLEALGLASYVCESCHKTFEARADLEKHESLMFICEHGCPNHFHSLEEVEAHYGSMHTPKRNVVPTVTLAADHPAVKAWDAVLEHLGVDMNRASFENWVQGTQAVAFDGQVLTVGASNLITRDWLESRLESTVERLLIGILNAQVQVRFVVADLVEEESDGD